MKRIILWLVVILCVPTIYAQTLDKNELKQLKSFLVQTNERGESNAKRLKISDINNPMSWHGLMVENGHVVSIDWHGKLLSGDLSLNKFTKLKSVDVSHNHIKSLSLNGDGIIEKVNASHNKLSSIGLDGCVALVHLQINNNRLTDMTMSDVPSLQYLNCSQNLCNLMLDMQRR